MNTVAIIPARGGSKGIPRKNLRPMAGKPLIYYSINACLQSSEITDVVVSTDDEEIALFAERFGADVIYRDEQLSNDLATIDPVIENAVKRYEEDKRKKYDVVITVQPTSPLVTDKEITNAVIQFKKEKVDTLMSVVDDRHLCWELKNSVPIPAYRERVNRQELPKKYKETGAVIICKRETLDSGSRIGSSVSLFIMEHDKSHDIDTLSDFYLCESLLKSRYVLFVVAGNKNIGLGHAYRTVMLANELVKNKIKFVVEEKDELAKQYITSFNYPVEIVASEELLAFVSSEKPDMIINDVLDTESSYIKSLKDIGVKVVNFEDLGTGIEYADLVFNALYPTKLPYVHVKSGADYFCLREEFLHLPETEVRNQVESVLLCFGGVDEGNITKRVLKAIIEICTKNNIKIIIILGLGYQYEKELESYISSTDYNDLELVKATSKISDYMAKADLAITSGGRTVFELAAMKVPTIVICQNKRELTHKFATSENGVINLGFRNDVDDELITSAFLSVSQSRDMRALMLEKAEVQNLTKGKKRVISMIESLLED